MREGHATGRTVMRQTGEQREDETYVSSGTRVKRHQSVLTKYSDDDESDVVGWLRGPGGVRGVEGVSDLPLAVQPRTRDVDNDTSAQRA